MHDIFEAAFEDEMRKLGGPISPLAQPNVNWGNLDVPAEPWTKRQEWAYDRARKLAKSPQDLDRMLHYARVQAMEEAAARPAGRLANFAQTGALDVGDHGVREMDQSMRLAIQRGDKNVRRRPEMFRQEIGSPVSKMERSLGAARPLGIGEWLRSIMTRRAQAARAIRTLVR